MVAILAFLGPGVSAFAHPHAWIDMQVEVLFNKTGDVTGLRQVWQMDEAYSTFVLQGLIEHDSSTYTPAELQLVADTIMGNLQPSGYLTTILDGQKVVPVSAIDAAQAQLKDQRLSLAFTMVFAQTIRAADFAYKTFDPSYYVEMLHKDGEAGISFPGAPEGCKLGFVHPNPPMEAVVKAAGMDPMAMPDDTMGILFAEEVKLICP